MRLCPRQLVGAPLASQVRALLENLFNERSTEDILLELGPALPPPPEKKKLKKIYTSPQPGELTPTDKDYRWPGLKAPKGGALPIGRSHRTARKSR